MESIISTAPATPVPMAIPEKLEQFLQETDVIPKGNWSNGKGYSKK